MMENMDLENVDKIQETVQHLLQCVQTKENQQYHQFSPTIFMVPGILRAVSPSCFDPRVVAIGPLHRDHNNVHALETWKPSYMIRLMSRINSPQEETMKSCVEKVYSSIDRIKICYIWNKTYSDAQIAEMMVLDTCFILEFIFQMRVLNEVSYIDTFLAENVKCDLLLLENQIPFFILNDIFHCTVSKFMGDISLVEYILPVISIQLFKTNMEFVDTVNISIHTTHHILSLLHKCYKPREHVIQPSHFSTTLVRSAIDLDRAGVSFEPNQNPTWVMAMEVELYMFLCFFKSWSKPTLRMAILMVGDNTEFVLRNLIAYEQMYESTDSYFTSYVAIMDKLVNTPKDVAMLVDSGVLINLMGSDEEVASMINGLCKNVIVIHRFYIEQCNILNKYCDLYWPKQIAWMRSTYFNSPWNIIALFAGIFLFILTFLQTVFTIMSAS